MIGTEIDETSIRTAIQNIETNNLQRLIKGKCKTYYYIPRFYTVLIFQHNILLSVVKVDEGSILKDIVKEDDEYHFTMCNPPFFETEQSTKVAKRLPPRNAPTGNETELTVQGGEREFVIRMIEESMEIKEKVKIYTTMFGRRCNLLFLLKCLKRKNIENVTWTEFCQGHTKRCVHTVLQRSTTLCNQLFYQYYILIDGVWLGHFYQRT